MTKIVPTKTERTLYSLSTESWVQVSRIQNEREVLFND